MIRKIYTLLILGLCLGLTCHHSCVPVPIFQIRNHIFRLNPFADCIRKHTFQAVAGIKLNPTLVGN